MTPAFAPTNDREPPPRGEPRIPSITRDELRAFLKRPSTHERIRRIVLARVSRKTPRHVVEEMIQEANIAVMTAKWAPRSLETARGWIGTVTVRAMVTYLRRGAKDPKWIRIEQEVTDIGVESADLPDTAPARWLISRWLGRAVTHNERDQETLEMLAYKARTNKSLDELAAEHGMTVQALKSRILNFQKKYEPRLRARRLTLLLGSVALALGIAFAAWLLGRVSSARAARAEAASLVAAPR